ncbi:DegT/DnrJ/EryC1/StrS aminotransferase family protein [Glaciimonas sp. PAMC28666]|uniref:DegT/DnrJ/EryC1/StrS family aminotransferase n=1 Tax=Glaciimonas sp. PAMC28666 TaxID=2807626 RepID=UPI0019654BAD|nr:DegT/DnrJ/EryC1/StrS family aminotransferase [Glaciimonas sp. PAMC28666]QRX81011.1 DegT/DnrJ/EryC1/StrS family aminotransferase [Glaciimonas sp. PAMC28666]
MKPLKAINDLFRHNQPLEAQISGVFKRFFDKGWYILGSEVGSFEKEFAQYCGVEFAIGVANGTDAIELGLRALGVQAGQKVALVANAGGYGTIGINAIDAVPVYVDVDATTFNMDVKSLEAVLDKQDIKAIIVTHLYGNLANIDEISNLASSKGIKLMEDCAQAHGAYRQGKKAGSWGDLATFSFYPTKNLGALGDGGAIVTKDATIAERVKQFRQYGWDQKYRSTLCYGRNSRLDEIQAAILRIKLPLLNEWNARRSAIAGLYGALINHPRIILPRVSGADHVAHLYVIRTGQRASLSQHLRASDVPHDIHFPVPDHRQPMFLDRFSDVVLPVSEVLCNEVLTLPCFPEMNDEEVNWVAAAVNKWIP